MSFPLRAPQLISQTNLAWDPRELERGTCGLYRAPALVAADLMPSMHELMQTAPVPDLADYEVCIKVHMLMPGQFPCIPNWHTDMVPRDENGLRFDRVTEGAPPMLLWISDGPETEFLARPLVMPELPKSHRDIASFVNEHRPMTQFIQPNCWWAMDQRTPHRGTQATEFGWRVFARLTHRSIAPGKRPDWVRRRHAQVYLDAAQFGW